MLVNQVVLHIKEEHAFSLIACKENVKEMFNIVWRARERERERVFT